MTLKQTARLVGKRLAFLLELEANAKPLVDAPDDSDMTNAIALVSWIVAHGFTGIADDEPAIESAVFGLLSMGVQGCMDVYGEDMAEASRALGIMPPGTITAVHLLETIERLIRNGGVARAFTTTRGIVDTINGNNPGGLN